MDQIIRVVLHFDHFALDLTRGYLRIGDRDIELPPKPFEILRYLAENAGRLVTKDELCSAAWPNVTVSDDSLVQCIRMLRQKLGDTDHHLIKTVPRRGYLLDATAVNPPPSQFEGAASQAERRDMRKHDVRENAGSPNRDIPAIMSSKLQAAILAGLVVSVVLLAVQLVTTVCQPAHRVVSHAEATLLPRIPPPASELFTDIDARLVAEIAATKALPLPPYVVQKPAADVPEPFRHFVGIWISEAGWPGSGRQLMVIVTAVDASGIAEGYVVDGPPQPTSRDQAAARFSPFIARISGETFRFGSASGERVASMMQNRRIEFRRTWREGGTSSVVLSPVWTLLKREQKG